MELQFAQRGCRAMVSLKDGGVNMAFQPLCCRALQVGTGLFSLDLFGREGDMTIFTLQQNVLRRFGHDLSQARLLPLRISQDVLGVGYGIHPRGWPDSQELTIGAVCGRPGLRFRSKLLAHTRTLAPYAQVGDGTTTILGTEGEKHFVQLRPEQIEQVSVNGELVFINIKAEQHPQQLSVLVLVLIAPGQSTAFIEALHSGHVDYLTVNATVRSILLMPAPFAKRQHLKIYGYENLGYSRINILGFDKTDFQPDGSVFIPRVKACHLQKLATAGLLLRHAVQTIQSNQKYAKSSD
jgi:hypothetical protein